MGKFEQVSLTLFQELVMGAGVLLSEFTPSSGSLDKTKIIAATDGGGLIKVVPTLKDFGDGIDNVPGKTKQLARIEDWSVTCDFTGRTLTTSVGKLFLGAATIDATDTTKVTPNAELSTSDFTDLWWVADYSDKNGSTNGGFVAAHLMNALSTGGLSIQTANKDKGSFAASFQAFYDIEDIDTVPFELYVKAGTAESA